MARISTALQHIPELRREPSRLQLGWRNRSRYNGRWKNFLIRMCVRDGLLKAVLRGETGSGGIGHNRIELKRKEAIPVNRRREDILVVGRRSAILIIWREIRHERDFEEVPGRRKFNVYAMPPYLILRSESFRMRCPSKKVMDILGEHHFFQLPAGEPTSSVVNPVLVINGPYLDG